MIIAIVYCLLISLFSSSLLAQNNSVDPQTDVQQESYLNEHAQQDPAGHAEVKNADIKDTLPECETLEELLERLPTEQQQELQMALDELRAELMHAFSVIVYEALQNNETAQGLDDLLLHLSKRYPILRLARSKVLSSVILDIPLAIEL